VASVPDAQAALDGADELPETATTEEALYHLELRRDIEAGVLGVLLQVLTVGRHGPDVHGAVAVA
jgi:hypothetical protein